MGFQSLFRAARNLRVAFRSRGQAAAILLFLCAVAHLATPAHARRVALVIGNGAYTEAGRLPNATTDADDMAATLKRLEFDVSAAKDLDASRFEQTVATFVAKARGAEVALFYYAGHALQLGLTNYLLPTDARLANEFAVKRETIAAQDVVEQLEGAARMTLVFLDACRNNPLADRLRATLTTTGRSAVLGRGLARIDARGRHTHRLLRRTRPSRR